MKVAQETLEMHSLELLYVEILLKSLERFSQKYVLRIYEES